MSWLSNSLTGSTMLSTAPAVLYCTVEASVFGGGVEGPLGRRGPSAPRTRTTSAEGVAALVPPTPAASSIIEQHERADTGANWIWEAAVEPSHPMQHATCNMRLCRQRCELNGC